MRKVFASLVVLVLLCAMAGCGLFERQREAAPEAATEITTEVIVTEEPTAAMPEGYSWASFYAATPTHFYAKTTKGFMHAPLSDISKQTPFPLPVEYKSLSQPLDWPRICGITSEWLFVNWHVGHQASVVYRISLTTGEAELVTECKGTAWYNAGSNSLLLFNSDGESWRLEALDLASGKRRTIYEEFHCDPWSDIWYNLKDGTIAMELALQYGDDELEYLYIDAANQVKRASKERVQETYDLTRPVECYGWLYFVEIVNDVRNLCRMKPDGTGKELLRAKTNIRQMAEANGKLFALAAYPKPWEDDPTTFDDEKMLHELGADGKPLWNKKCGMDGENSVTVMYKMGEKILISLNGYGGGHVKYFTLLYDPATGQTLEGTK